jgi:hypothetical protein
MQPRPGLQLPVRPTATRGRSWLGLKPTPEKQLAPAHRGELGPMRDRRPPEGRGEGSH